MTKGAYNPRGAYAKTQRVYLIAWMLKYGVGDHIWGSLRTANMDPIGKPFLIGDSGNFPVVIAGEADFLVVWLDGKQLGAARVTLDQQVTPVAVSGSGDPVIGWDIVVRAGQPALVWAETEANDFATLRFDPLCN